MMPFEQAAIGMSWLPILRRKLSAGMAQLVLPAHA